MEGHYDDGRVSSWITSLVADPMHIVIKNSPFPPVATEVAVLLEILPLMFFAFKEGTLEIIKPKVDVTNCRWKNGRNDYAFASFTPSAYWSAGSYFAIFCHHDMFAEYIHVWCWIGHLNRILASSIHHRS